MVAIAVGAVVVFVVLFPDILSLRLARSAWVAIKRSTRFHVNFLINVSSLIKQNKSLGIEESNYPLNKGINYCRFANELFTSCANKYILDEEPGLKITQSPHLKKRNANEILQELENKNNIKWKYYWKCFIKWLSTNLTFFIGEWTEKTKLIFHAKVWLLGKRVILVVWPDISILTLIEAELHSTNSGHRLIGFILSWKNLIMTEKKKEVYYSNTYKTNACILSAGFRAWNVRVVDFLNFSGHCPLEMQTWSEWVYFHKWNERLTTVYSRLY